MIGSADLETLSQATLRLYSPELTIGNFTEHAYQFLNQFTACDLINYGDLDPATGSLNATSSHQPPDWTSAVEGFGRCMGSYPLFRFDPTVNGGKPFFRNDFFTAREFRQLDIYSECFRLLGANNHAAVHVASDDGHVHYFALERGGRADYSERDRIMLGHAQHHLANARCLALARQKMRPESALEPVRFCHLGFTPRESDVAFWLTQGKTNLEIAILLKVSQHTVKAHLTALFNKTGASNRLALTLHVMEISHTLQTDQLWHHTQQA